MKQVITIGPDGSMSGLQVKPGKGLDLRQFGDADIQRASEIEWDTYHQGWFVGIRKGRYANLTICRALLEEIGFTGTLPIHEVKDHSIGVNEVLFWVDYDEAVKAEIAVLDHIRLTQGAASLN